MPRKQRFLPSILNACLIVAALMLVAVAAQAQPADRQPVKAVAGHWLTIARGTQQGRLPVFLSADWSTPRPAVTRAVIMVHGTLRNADAYLRLAEQASDAAGASDQTTLLVAPQFLTEVDVTAHHLPADTLRWDRDGWKAGSSAEGPIPLSSFEALDAVLAHLADATLFPAMRTVVMAGHSGGAQVVQRYAAVGSGDAVLLRRGIGVRYVVANPSSWLWFGEARPNPVDRAACPGFDQWKYGLRGVPPYAGDPTAAESRYFARDVVYLLGEEDTDPRHPFLDRSCAAMTQGETRFARGMLFMLFMEQRRPNLLHHRVFPLPGVSHNAARVFATPCGMAALFDRPGCAGLDGPAR